MILQFRSESSAPISVINEVEFSVDDQHQIPQNEFKTKNLNFAHSFRPIYYCSRVFGLTPFSIIYDSDDEVQMPKVGVLDSFWFVVSICLYLIMAYSSYHQMIVNQYQSIPNVLVIGGYMISILSLIFGAVIVGIDMWSRFRLVDVLKKITTFDKEVS